MGPTIYRFTTTVLSILLLLDPVRCQLPAASDDPFARQVPSFHLTDQSVIDGVAMLSQFTDIAFAVEFPLGGTISAPAPTPATVNAMVGPTTLGSALDRLCELDRKFSWRRIGNTAHIFPQAMEQDPTYLFNRKIDLLSFKDEPGAQEAVFHAVAQLAGPKQQIAVLQSGPPLGFSQPWTAKFKDITLREAFDKIAQQLGPTYGWQFGGAADFRVVTFHERLTVKPRQNNPESQ
jgi:hypothetical protein